jgi:hypothetical protein
MYSDPLPPGSQLDPTWSGVSQMHPNDLNQSRWLPWKKFKDRDLVGTQARKTKQMKVIYNNEDDNY